MASPHFYLTRRCVLDATAPHRTSCWFPAQRGATGVLQLSDRSRLSHGGLNRLRLESVYTLLLLREHSGHLMLPNADERIHLAHVDHHRA